MAGTASADMASSGWTLFALLLPFAAAIVAPFLVRRLGHNAAWPLALAPAFIFIHLCGYLGPVSDGQVVTGGHAWIPSLNVSFSWLIDGLSLTFGLLISGIGTFIILYAGGYLKGHAQLGRFLSFMFMFMGSMLGLVMSDSLLMLFVYWELTSITSFLLIGFDHTRAASRRAAVQALVVTGLGGLSLLAGLIFLWNITGMSVMSLMLESGDVVRDSPFYLAAFVLVLGGAFTKSAQFPLHFWLPNAMEAPTPVSAYLHSATMVKAGVYLLMRLNPVLGDTFAWETVLPLFGGTTLIVGTLLAVRQTDLKLMLAYTTVASLGILVMLTGFGTEKAIEGAVLYLIAHSLFKGTLFMVAGAIDHEAGTRDVTKLSGLRKAMPITFVAAVLAALSMGGLPPFMGFLAKEEIYAGIAFAGFWPVLITVTAILGNALMLVIGFAVAFKPFLGPEIKTPKHAHEAPALMWLGPATLGALGLVAALLYTVTHHLLSSPMASAVAGTAIEVHIAPLPHISLAFGLSLLTIALGVACYLKLDLLRERMGAILKAIGWGPDQGFDQAIAGTVRFATGVTRIFHGGRMEVYMTTVMIMIGAAFLLPMIIFDELPHWPAWPQLFIYEWTVLALAIVGALAVIFARDRLSAIVSLGVQGFAVALLFMLMGAPDLSFTQFMVETLSVVILALVMTRLKLTPSDHRPLREAFGDILVAAACGLGLGLMLLKVTQQPFDNTLTDFFNAYSTSIAHGRNIVNVILVDFRGFDTFGEIAVVMITGLAILALIRVRAVAPPVDNQPEEEA
jgi:multicomponent Na+:H+ antiporter subunit A